MQRLEPGRLAPEMDRELDGLQQPFVGDQMWMLSLAKEGDIEARNELVESCLPLIRYYLHKYHRDIDEADAMQDCAVALLSKIHTYDPARSSMSRYVRLCMEQVLTDQYRKSQANRRRGETVPMDVEAMERFAGTEDPDVFAGDLKLRLADAVEMMGSSRRPESSIVARERAARVLSLLYGLDGREPMTQVQVAEMCGCSPQAISLDKSFGIAQLRRMPSVKSLLVYLRED